MYATRLIDMCDMTHSYLWHDSLLCRFCSFLERCLCVPWLVVVCTLTHLCVSWLIDVCDTTHWCAGSAHFWSAAMVGRVSQTSCVQVLECVYDFSRLCVTWLIQFFCDMIRLSVTWHIWNLFGMTHFVGWVSRTLRVRGGGLGSSTIFKKFNETYAPS